MNFRKLIYLKNSMNFWGFTSLKIFKPVNISWSILKASQTSLCDLCQILLVDYKSPKQQLGSEPQASSTTSPARSPGPLASPGQGDTATWVDPTLSQPAGIAAGWALCPPAWLTAKWPWIPFPDAHATKPLSLKHLKFPLLLQFFVHAPSLSVLYCTHLCNNTYLTFLLLWNSFKTLSFNPFFLSQIPPSTSF